MAMIDEMPENRNVRVSTSIGKWQTGVNMFRVMSRFTIFFSFSLRRCMMCNTSLAADDGMLQIVQ